VERTLAIEHIVSDPDRHGGRPYIAGKGITVHYIAQLYTLDWSLDDLVEEFELTPGQVYAALSYYFDHKDEIDRHIRVSNLETAKQLQELTRQGKAILADDLKRRIEARKASK
jgi:uncharacterized protein (DUF433 family)